MSLALPNTDAAPAAFSSAEFRQALSQFATGVTVVTACDANGERAGLTVSSFNSVSLQPPLVLWSLNQASQSMAVLGQAQHYAIHVLGAHQLALAERFTGPREARWVDLPHRWSAHGVPLLDDCLAVFECRHRSHHEEGDHLIFVAQVERCHRGSDAPPLLYHRSRLITETGL
jgi:flavin reductase (DIM6/NTAB) family NADH-FMN oxidoreductase RutF